MFDVDSAIINAAKARNRAAVAAFRALKQSIDVVLALPGTDPKRELSDGEIRDLMRAEIRRRREFNEFVPPSSDEYQRNREVISVLNDRVQRGNRPTRRRPLPRGDGRPG